MSATVAILNPALFNFAKKVFVDRESRYILRYPGKGQALGL
jgi:hypothetical protein